jgi:transcriptional regulator of acetoin/glycerol metabolism
MRIAGVQLDFPLLHYSDALVALGPMEKDYVAWALLGERGNRSATARRLALTRTTFLRHLKRLGLEDLIAPPEDDLPFVR